MLKGTSRWNHSKEITGPSLYEGKQVQRKKSSLIQKDKIIPEIKTDKQDFGNEIPTSFSTKTEESIDKTWLRLVERILNDGASKAKGK